MDAQQILVGRLSRRDDLAALLAPARRHHLHRFGPLDALGMARRREVIGKPIGRDEH